MSQLGDVNTEGEGGVGGVGGRGRGRVNIRSNTLKNVIIRHC